MDAIGLTVLIKEIEADCAVIQDAARKAQVRMLDGADGRLEACAYELARLYNVLEKILEREDRVKELAALAGDLAGQLPLWSRKFAEQTRAEQGWK